MVIVGNGGIFTAYTDALSSAPTANRGVALPVTVIASAGAGSLRQCDQPPSEGEKVRTDARAQPGESAAKATARWSSGSRPEEDGEGDRGG